MSMADAPDYVKNFRKPPKTEIKQFGNHYYLYGCTYQYDKERRRSRKIPGKYMGVITEKGLVPPHSKTAPPVEESIYPTSYAEVGAVCYFYPRTEDMRIRLQKYFPELWKQIYVAALIRAVYHCPLGHLEMHYEYSILSDLFPGLSFNRGFLQALGRQREAIVSYMREDVEKAEGIILVDGASFQLPDVLFMFSVGEDIGKAVYYKQYTGGSADAEDYLDILAEAGMDGSGVTALADQGFIGDEDLNLLDGENIRYVAALKRGNRFVKGRVPAAVADYEEMFMDHDRAVFCVTFKDEEDGVNIHLFLDVGLWTKEAADMAGKTMSVKEAYRGNEDIGTITLKTTRLDLSAAQSYFLYKQYKNIESFFSTYDSASDRQDKLSEEGWLFLNHLSAAISIRTMEEIDRLGESKNLSFGDLTDMLVKIQSSKVGGKWQKPVLKKVARQMFDRVHFDAADLSVLPLDGVEREEI